MAVAAVGQHEVAGEPGGGDAGGVAVLQHDGAAVEAVVVQEQAADGGEPGRRACRGGAAIDGAAAVEGDVVAEQAVAQCQGSADGIDGAAGVAVATVEE